VCLIWCFANVSAALLLAFVPPQGLVRALVCDDELLCALDHVLLLCYYDLPIAEGTEEYCTGKARLMILR
jgi:hypothetical protein